MTKRVDIKKRRRKERPICRLHLRRVMARDSCSLNDLLQPPYHLTHGMHIQAEKMELERRAGLRS